MGEPNSFVSLKVLHDGWLWDAKSRTFVIVRIKIRGNYYDRRFGCWESPAVSTPYFYPNGDKCPRLCISNSFVLFKIKCKICAWQKLDFSKQCHGSHQRLGFGIGSYTLCTTPSFVLLQHNFIVWSPINKSVIIQSEKVQNRFINFKQCQTCRDDGDGTWWNSLK